MKCMGMKSTKEIFEILSRGGFISSNSIRPQVRHLYDLLEESFQDYYDYYKGIGFELQGGNGYWYFSRTETKVELNDKLQRFCAWIDRLDFLKTYNNSFGPGMSFRKAAIVEQMSSDIELKDKAKKLYKERMSFDEVVDKVVDDMDKAGFVELENEMDGTWKVSSAFHYLEEMVDCLTIVEEPENEEKV